MEVGKKEEILEKTKATAILMINKGFKDEIIKEVLNIDDNFLSEIKKN